MRMLKLFHRLDLTLDLLLHAKLANLLFVEDFQSDWLANGFIFGHYIQKAWVRWAS